MQTRVQKWGDSLALRIPEDVASQAGLAEDALVDVSLEQGRLVVSVSSRKKLTLDELLRGVTDENIHAEIDFGPPVGKEEW